METYRIYCEEGDRAQVMSILRKYNDVVINHVDGQSFNITIEGDGADVLYRHILDEIDNDVLRYRREGERSSIH